MRAFQSGIFQSVRICAYLLHTTDDDPIVRSVLLNNLSGASEFRQTMCYLNINININNMPHSVRLTAPES